MTPALSIVIPTLGRRATLDTCLARLAAQDTDAPFEVLLCADAAAEDPDGLARRLEQAGLPDARLVRAARAGASEARNAGWRAASAPVVLFVDDDVLADPGLVAAHLRAHAAHPSPALGVLGFVRWASSLRVTPFMRWIEDGLQFDFVALRGRDRTGWWHLYTCNCSIKREALAAVGGLDATGFPFGYEDLDLGRRLHDAMGFELLVARDATAEHEHAMTLEQWRTRVGRIARSERRWVARYPDSPAHWHDRLSAAAAQPALAGRAARLTRWVPRRTPWLGPLVHGHAQGWYAQQLATPFLRAWDEAADEDPGPPPAIE